MSGLLRLVDGWKAPQSTAGGASRSGAPGSEPTPIPRTHRREFSYPVVRPIPTGQLVRLHNVNGRGTTPGRPDNPCAWPALDARQGR